MEANASTVGPVSELTELASSRLAAAVDLDAAPAMQAYMKTEMPFFGVKRPQRRPIERELIRMFPAVDAATYRRNVNELWDLPHREEKYLAISYARGFPAFIVPDQLDLFERLVREGAWWDLVDETAIHLIGRVLLDHRGQTRAALEQWIDDPDLWIRRTALICQITHKTATDATMLFDFCSRRAHETDFFIRKAIGWALREYAKTAPDDVRTWVALHEAQLSGLSRREALKHLA
jgi:3-methyladenine DNA glycosylase AlkD